MKIFPAQENDFELIQEFVLENEPVREEDEPDFEPYDWM